MTAKLQAFAVEVSADARRVRLDAEVISGTPVPGMLVAIAFNQSVAMTAPIADVEWVSHKRVFLMIDCARPDEAELWRDLNIGDETIELLSPEDVERMVKPSGGAHGSHEFKHAPREEGRPNWRAFSILAILILVTWWRMSFELRLSVLFLWPILLLTSFVPGAPLGQYGYEGSVLHPVAAIVALPFTLAYWGFVLLQVGRWLKRR